MSVVLYEDCDICKNTNIVQINEDLQMKISYPLMCERNNLPYTIQTIKMLTKHQINHIETPSTVLARAMLHEEAVQLKNTAIETNLSLDQVDLMLVEVFLMIKSEEDRIIKHKLIKNFTDLQKTKKDFLMFHHKISGKELVDDLRRASLTETVKAVGRELGDKAVQEIQRDAKKKRSITEFLQADDFMNELYDTSQEDNTDYTIQD